MIAEFIIAAGVTYSLDRFRNREFYKQEKIFNKTCMLEDKSFLIINTWITQYGTKFLISLKNREFKDLEKLKDKLETNFSSRIEIEQNENMSTAYMYVLKSRLNDREFKFKPTSTKAYELYLGLDNRLEPVIVDLNKFPHVLNTGATGSGKSEELKIIISNLIINHSERDINLHFSNISLSNDFHQFLNCKQVKSYVEKIEDSLEQFKYLNHLYEKRLSIFRSSNCVDIKEYNKKFPQKRMNYQYLFIDEFADFFPSNKFENDYDCKVKCYNELKHLVRKARKTGIFLILSLQRPDVSVLDPSLRSNLCVKISFYQNNDASSLTVADTTELTNIKEREMLVLYGNKKIWSRSLYINKSIIYSTIKESIIKDRQQQVDFNKFFKNNNSKQLINEKKVNKPQIAKKRTKTLNKKEKTKVKNIEVLKIS